MKVDDVKVFHLGQNVDLFPNVLSGDAAAGGLEPARKKTHFKSTFNEFYGFTNLT